MASRADSGLSASAPDLHGMLNSAMHTDDASAREHRSERGGACVGVVGLSPGQQVLWSDRFNRCSSSRTPGARARVDTESGGHHVPHEHTQVASQLPFVGAQNRTMHAVLPQLLTDLAGLAEQVGDAGARV
eukprot:364938-Chlamydomonas_euryale.AAC.8